MKIVAEKGLSTRLYRRRRKSNEMKKSPHIVGIAGFLLGTCALACADIPGNVGPAAATMPRLQNVGFERRSTANAAGPRLPRRNRRTVQLREYFGQKPVVLAFVYYNCPMLCDQSNRASSACCACFVQSGCDYEWFS